MEPLKGKQFANAMGEPSQLIYFHLDKDIVCAVEWLKDKIIQEKISSEIYYEESEDTQTQGCILAYDECIKFINEAFEDVIKK